jgi:hypothetical protein
LRIKGISGPPSGTFESRSTRTSEFEEIIGKAVARKRPQINTDIIVRYLGKIDGKT